MAGTSVYSREISPNEARGGYIVICRCKLPLFPPPGETFEMRRGRLVRQVEVEPARCPNDGQLNGHYVLRWNGLTVGRRVVIKQPSRPGGRYVLTQMQ
jgi:hypothetical protein